MRQAIRILYVILYSVKIALKLKIRMIEEIYEIVEKLIELADKLKEGNDDDQHVTEGKQVVRSGGSRVNGRQGSGANPIPNVIVLQGKRQSC